MDKRYVVFSITKKDLSRAFDKDMNVKRWIELFSDMDMKAITERIERTYLEGWYIGDLRNAVSNLISAKQMVNEKGDE